jgi:hypothetical protein
MIEKSCAAMPWNYSGEPARFSIERDYAPPRRTKPVSKWVNFAKYLKFTRVDHRTERIRCIQIAPRRTEPVPAAPNEAIGYSRRRSDSTFSPALPIAPGFLLNA